MKKILILFYYPKKKFSISNKEIRNFKKNYSSIILYNSINRDNSYKFKYNKNNLNNISKNYKKLDIYLDIKKIYEIDLFLKKIKKQNKNKKIFISPYFMSGVILEEEFIFYELSKIYKLQFVRPELSFIKNRFILAKNFFKQPYILKKKTYFTKREFDEFKISYRSSMQFFSEIINRSYIKSNLNLILVKILNLFFNFRLNKKPKEYALVILNNNRNLVALSNILNLKKYLKLILNKFNYELVFLIHPNTNLLYFFLRMIKNKHFYFQNKRVIFLQKPKNLFNLIENSKFIIHLSSSLSAQSLIFNKKILYLSNNPIYIKNISNVVSNIKKNFKFLKRKSSKIDIRKSDKFLINLLLNSVDIKGELKLSKKIKGDTSTYLRNSKETKVKIIQSLLNII